MRDGVYWACSGTESKNFEPLAAHPFSIQISSGGVAALFSLGD